MQEEAKKSGNSKHKEISPKEKIKILKSLNSSTLSPESLSSFFQYTSVPELFQPVLEKILEYLVDLDSQIGAAARLMSPEDWENLDNDFEHFETKTQKDCFVLYFWMFREKFSQRNGQSSKNESEGCSREASKGRDGGSGGNSTAAEVEKTARTYTCDSAQQINNETVKKEVSLILKILSPLFKVRTKNIQFLVFLLALDHPRPVLSFLLSRLRSNPTIYASFFSSLLVRLDCGSSYYAQGLKHNCFNAFVKHLTSILVPNKMDAKNLYSTSYLLLLQSLLYILCFKEFHLEMHGDCASRNLLDRILTECDGGRSPLALLNKDVVVRFCEIYGYAIPSFLPQPNELFYFFPFDLPIIKEIEKKIEEHYISFC